MKGSRIVDTARGVESACYIHYRIGVTIPPLTPTVELLNVLLVADLLDVASERESVENSMAGSEDVSVCLRSVCCISLSMLVQR